MHAQGQDPSDDRASRFIALLSRHERRVKCHILALVPNWQEAEEVYSETNLRLWEQFDRYDPERDFGAWACTIAYYQVLTHRKRQSRSRQILSQEAIEALSQENSERSELENRRVAALAHCLEKVSASGRELLERCYGGSKTIKEVAAEINRTSSAVYSTLMSR